MGGDEGPEVTKEMSSTGESGENDKRNISSDHKCFVNLRKEQMKEYANEIHFVIVASE